MSAHQIDTETALAILQRRGLEFRKRGTAWLALCPVHADSHPSMRLWTGRDGAVKISCFPCGFTDSLPRFLCRMDGQEPQGKAWRDALAECGLAEDRDAIPKPKVWPRHLQSGRADIPIAMACNTPQPVAEMKAFIEGEAAKKYDIQSPYMRKLVDGWQALERRVK